MSVNKYLPHVYVIPEDRANEQIANGFVLHDQVKANRIDVLPCAGGWSAVREKFTAEYIAHLRKFKDGYILLLIDFDDCYDTRRIAFDEAVPDDLKSRVFVVGSKESPEVLRRRLLLNLEDLGMALADDCYEGTTDVWSHEHLRHNDPDLQRLTETVKSILFAS